MSVTISTSDLRTLYRGAGVFTVISDNSASPQPVDNRQIRLVAGFSKVGPINRAILIHDLKTAIQVFGPRDKSLERKGSFFHKMLHTALSAGPVLAINLVPLNDGMDTDTELPLPTADTAKYISLSTTPQKQNGVKTTKLYSSYFNKQRYYVPSAEYLLATRDIVDQNKIFNIVNLSSQKLSFIIRKAHVPQYDVKITEWYGDEAIPGYLRPDLYLSDYFIDVIAIVGDYSNYDQLSVSATFGDCFTSTGLIASKLDTFLSKAEVSTKFRFVGSLIPNLMDKDGSSISIDAMINSNILQYNVLCAIDSELLDTYSDDEDTTAIDLIGNSLVGNIPQMDFLSYKENLISMFVYNGKNKYDTSNQAVGGFDSSTDSGGEALKNQLDVTYHAGKINVVYTWSQGESAESNILESEFMRIKNNIRNGNYVLGTSSREDEYISTQDGSYYFDDNIEYSESRTWLRVTNLIINQRNIIFDLVSDMKLQETQSGYDNAAVTLIGSEQEPVVHVLFKADTVGMIGENPTRFAGEVDSQLYKDCKSGAVDSFQNIYDSDGTKYWIKKEYVNDTYMGVSGVVISVYQDQELTIPADIELFTHAYDPNRRIIGDNAVAIFSSKEGLSETYTTTSLSNSTSVNLIPDILTVGVKIGDWVVCEDADGTEFLSRITSIVKNTAQEPFITITSENQIRVYQNSGNNIIRVFKHYEDVISNLNFICFDGFQIKKSAYPDGTNQKIKQIYRVMTETNIGKALQDPEFANFRYFVDTFNGGLEPNSKSYLTTFLKKRQRCLGFLNCPTTKEFKKSLNPRFTTQPTAQNPLPELDVNYIVSGGNLELMPSWRYTLPSEELGASFAGYIFPNIEIREDDGSMLSVPPSAYVSNAFMRKFSTTDEFKPAAGILRGAIVGSEVVGPDFPMIKEEYGELIEFGINPIITKSGNPVLYGNETAYKKFISALNNLHVRDALITFEIESTSKLEAYVFDFNDDTNRSTIATILRNYYEKIEKTYKVISSVEIVMDGTNNPGEFLDANAGVVDTIISFAGINKKLINRISIRGNSVSSSSFVVV